MKNALRNMTIVLGLLSFYGFVWTALSFLSRFGPRFMSSSDQLGSNVLLYFIAGFPAAVGSAAAGVVGALAFPEIGKVQVGALTILIAFWYAGSFSFRWNLGLIDMESRIGWLLSIAFVVASCLAAYVVTRNGPWHRPATAA